MGGEVKVEGGIKFVPSPLADKLDQTSLTPTKKKPIIVPAKTSNLDVDVVLNAKLKPADDGNNGNGNGYQLVEAEFKSYPQRWWLLTTVIILNLANYSHWVAFPSVTKMVAKYYDQSGETMDLIPTLSYGLGIPCCLLATYVVDRFGLKVGLHIGGNLTGIGKLVLTDNQIEAEQI